jgi:ABC-type glycerol-3-phosphate transport system permease component
MSVQAAVVRPRNARRARLAGSILLHGALLIGAAVCLFPFVWNLTGSIKTIADMMSYPPTIFPPVIHYENYAKLITDYPYLRWYGNSLLVALVTTVLATFFSALGGYGFAKFDFRLRQPLFAVIIGALIVPQVATLIPSYLEMAYFGWIDSYLALVIPAATPAFGIFLMRQYIVQGVPGEIIDAARIDGSGEFNTFLQVALPLVRPAIGAFAIYEFLGAWNSFLWPLIIIRSATLVTLPLGLATFQDIRRENDWGTMMAGVVLSLVPIFILFIILQRQFIAGLTLGAVKG